MSQNTISEITRRAIADHFAVAEVEWWGRLAEDEFLCRLYDLEAMPSTDPRHKTAVGDIHQHRIRWKDWQDDWIFYDQRIGLLSCPDLEFLKFLCETLHPAVRPNSDDARANAVAINHELKNDGWSLVEDHLISGRPVYAPQRIGTRHQVFPDPTGWQKVDRQLQQAREQLDAAVTEEQFQTVGLLCREALITLAQEVFDGESMRTGDDLVPSNTDAARMLEAYFGSTLKGGANEEARRHAKAALSLALALQHRRTADFRMAALCAEATASVVNVVAILSGRRSPSHKAALPESNSEPDLPEPTQYP